MSPELGTAGLPRPEHAVTVGFQPASEAIHHRGFTCALPAFNGNEFAFHQFLLINFWVSELIKPFLAHSCNRNQGAPNLCAAGA